MDTKDIKFIRAFWGNFESYKNEIPKIPLYNEMVYVWGEENLIKFKSNGYDVFYMGEIDSNKQYQYNLKLDCLIEAEKQFGEILFMDWDVNKSQILDDIFFKELRYSNFSMPTYSYPIEFLDIEFEDEWGKSIISELKTYGWLLDNFIIIPNAGFIYSNKSGIPIILKNISEQNNITTLVEEISMWIYSNCTLEEYIKKYEPKCIYGRKTNSNFTLRNINKKTEITLHNFINKLITKNIYFIHE